MSDDGATIIKFPKKHLRPEILNEEVAKRWEQGKVYFVAEMTARYCEQAIEGLVSFGVDIDDPKYAKDIAYLTNVAAGIFSRMSDIPHDIHAAVDRAFEIKDTEGNFLGYVWKDSEGRANVAISVTE